MKRIRHRDKLFKRLDRKLTYERRKETYGKSWADFVKKYRNAKNPIVREKDACEKTNSALSNSLGKTRK